MCGIFAYLGKKNKHPLAYCLEGLKLLEYRGYDSCGIAGLKDSCLHCFKTEGKIDSLQSKLTANLELDIAICHTRWATHGKATELNAHPHLDHQSSLAIVHNGIIENYLAIKEKLLGKAITFKSDTDSEVIANLISFNYQDNLLDALIKSLKELDGSLAIALIHKNHPNTLLAAARHSPLAIGYSSNLLEFFLASDPNAFLGKNLQVIFLQKDEVAEISIKSLKIFNLDKKEKVKNPTRLNYKNYSLSKGKFEHYLIKEIHEQPITIQKGLLARMSEDFNVSLENFHLKKSELLAYKQIILTACGTAWHAASYGAMLIEQLLKIPARAEIASEFRYNNHLIDNSSLVIAVSQSGETADTLASVREAKQKNAKILSICNVNNSTLSRESDMCLFNKAGPEMSVCSTKAFTSQITLLMLLVAYLEKVKYGSSKGSLPILKELKMMPARIKKILTLSPAIEQLAKKYNNYENVFYLGRNYMHIAAKEAALKLKEIAYVNANAYAAGEMKHGPLALADQNLMTIALCNNALTYEKMLSNLMEIKARGSPILAVATENSKELEKIADDTIYIGKTSDETAILPVSVAMQLFAYFFAKNKNRNIDQPRNLAKSVTVE